MENYYVCLQNKTYTPCQGGVPLLASSEVVCNGIGKRLEFKQSRAPL